MRRVAMLVRNDVRHDARVQREATALSARYDVTIFGLDQGRLYGGAAALCVRLLPAAGAPAMRPKWKRYAPYGDFLKSALAALMAHQPELVHAHDLDALIPCAIVAARLGVPLIYDAHELYAEQGRHSWSGRKLVRLIEDLAMRRASAILTANESRAEFMWHQYRCPIRPTAIINCPASSHQPNVDNGRLRRWVSDQGRRWEHLVLYQGAFLGDRHLTELAGAAQLLPSTAGVVFVGEGPAEATIRAVGADRVLVHPLVPLSELIAFIAGADVGVVTYANTCLNNYLCAPNKLFDYAQAGVPLAVGDLPELVRLVSQFGAGTVFRNGDPSSMAREIAALLEEGHRLRNARVGAHRLAQEFTWEAQAGKLLSIYDRVLPAG